MKKLLVFCLALSVTVLSCSKKDDPKPGGGGGSTGTPGGTDPDPSASKDYYFKFAFDGKAYSFNTALAQYISSSEYKVGGYQMPPNALFPSVGLSFAFDHQPTDAEVKALAGKTIYFDDEALRPVLQFQETLSSDGFSTTDTADKAFFVKVNTVTYLKKDTTIFNEIDVYVINGTCNAVLTDYEPGSPWHTLTAGNFNFLISRVREK